jgi:hypothetical protein
MTINFNHAIVASRDKKESAEFLAELFGLPSSKPFGRFMVVALEHGVNLDFADAPEGEKIPRQHYAFLVSEQQFDTIYGKIQPIARPAALGGPRSKSGWRDQPQ